ncbi:MAG: dNTP triphosphohydrolase [Clostridia bacterium]|nr:dNTP triphosphohydrolase [Clostridia bacterium]
MQKDIQSDIQVGQIFNPNDRRKIANVDTCTNSKDMLWSNIGFSRDLSRIIFSNAYKRMAGKTQLFPVGYTDHYMNRLTHTLIVNNIAVDIATRVNSIYVEAQINLDLIQAIANGHDVGHTPFGHAGERTLQKLVSQRKTSHNSSANTIAHDKPTVTFKHNIFSVGILQGLERVKNFEYGYDLTWQTIDGILKHTDYEYDESLGNYFELKLKNEFLFSKKLLKTLNEVTPQKSPLNSYLQYKFPLTIEGQIVKIADEIAQYYHDVLDCSRFAEHNKLPNPIAKILERLKGRIYNNNEQPYVSKFLNTYYKNGRIADKKIFAPENRESFANDFKELFINDVIFTIQKALTKKKENRRKSRLIYDIDKSTGQKMIKNILFKTNKEGKVIPVFSSKYVRFASNVFVKYRNKILQSEVITTFDEMGASLINTMVERLLKNSSEFNKHCGKDILHNALVLLAANKIELCFQGEKLKLNNMCSLNEKNDQFAIAIHKYAFNKSAEELNLVFYPKDDSKTREIISDLVFTTIIETVARMTDNYINRSVDSEPCVEYVFSE